MNRTEDIYCKVIQLPAHVKAVTILKDNDYLILVNECLTQAARDRAMAHELTHIKNNHFYTYEHITIKEMEASEATKWSGERV